MPELPRAHREIHHPTSDVSVALPPRYPAGRFRGCLRGSGDEPRPLPPRHREMTWISRSETPSASERCAALAPPSRTAIAHRFRGRSRAVKPDSSGSPAGPTRRCAPCRPGFVSLLCPRLPPAPHGLWSKRISAARRTREGCDIDARLSSEGLVPVHHDSLRSFERLRSREGLLWTSGCSPVSARDEVHEHIREHRHPRVASSAHSPHGERHRPGVTATGYPASLLAGYACAARCTRHESAGFRRFTIARGWCVCRPSCPERRNRSPRRACCGFPSSKSTGHPVVIHLLPRRPGGSPPRLRTARRAGFPAERSRTSACKRISALLRPSAPRRALGAAKDLGCLPPIVPSMRPEDHSGSPWFGLGVTPPARGIATTKPAPFLLRYDRLALTSQADRRSSIEAAGRLPVPAARPQRPLGFYDSNSLAD